MVQHVSNGHSSQIEIYLLINSEKYEVAQIGNGSLILRDSRTIQPSTSAELVINIDGRSETKQIFLPVGVEHHRQSTPYRQIG